MASIPIPQPLIDTCQQLKEKNWQAFMPPSFAPYDLIFCLDFLKQYDNNNATFESYRREVERLIQWAWLIEKKSLLDLKRQDIENYMQFCFNPPKSWIGFKKVARFITHNGERIPNHEWRPFVATVSKIDHKNGLRPNKQNYQLSQKAIREIFTVLSSFYNYLALEEKVSINPITLIKQKSKYIQKTQHQAQVMRLSEKQWRTCLDTVKNMANNAPDRHERTLFIISALYLLYLRISELCASDRWTPEMRHFYQDSQGCWWFKTVGKGNKMRDIAVPDDMLAALKRYRVSMQLTPLPSMNDQSPLLPKEKGKGAMTSSRHIRRLVQDCFDNTIQNLRSTGFSIEADSFESATVHWLRHTGISDDINMRGRPVAHVRDDAGHSSSAITDRYNDIDLLERHQSAKYKRLMSKED
ncbi:TPA: site-specific integrase [Legionella pneumophila]|uniref:Site-specific integrase n=1 Tax=Legionella bononiensis TaxID=2793102 RepID=A0ABS1WF15_9GAMM|nr:MULTISPECIES: tyrosine-type recombinase/integrase [Legionellaceae]ERH41330.1 integrase [Legionella pneumophila str. Leg01/53]ERI47055.1 integrase [Legionella pneumophila str. Leg01/20]HAT8857953.1 tyrosine-type recombinase/integrase [Legionella pneumophila subsp. pneumophila]KTD12225.1 site specific recombinase, phage integrase [Legionella hackeliae]MBL7478572.1 site-specific integrase [Legionella bononiensis]